MHSTELQPRYKPTETTRSSTQPSSRILAKENARVWYDHDNGGMTACSRKDSRLGTHDSLKSVNPDRLHANFINLIAASKGSKDGFRYKMAIGWLPMQVYGYKVLVTNTLSPEYVQECTTNIRFTQFFDINSLPRRQRFALMKTDPTTFLSSFR